MNPDLLRAGGMAAFRFDQVVDRLRKPPSRAIVTGVLDETGRVVETAERLPVHQDGEVLLLDLPSDPAHALWRSQELTLFWRHRDLLAAPVLDYGCGDGSFAALFLDRVDYGVDIDEAALAIARQYGIYANLVRATGPTIDLPSDSIGSAFSNSVLEHVEGVESSLRELARVLRPGGVLAFTVPVRAFAEHLARRFGQADSERINSLWYHRNLHPAEWWADHLRASGLVVEKSIGYQPESFTFINRVMRTRLGSRYVRRGCAGAEYRAWMARTVRESLAGHPDGANVFLVARKPEVR